MKDLAKLLENPAFIPLSVGVSCNQHNVITVTHTADDIEKSLRYLLNKVVYCVV